MGRIYAIDAATDDYLYRIPGHQHGDGQIDSDDRPVWLLSSEPAVRDAGVDPDTLPRVDVDAPHTADTATD